MVVPFGAAAPPGPLSLSRPSTSSGATLSMGGGDGEALRRAPAARRSAEAWVSEGETGLDAAGSPFFLGGMLDEELADELDEDESSTCAPYLARQMSCLVARTPGV